MLLDLKNLDVVQGGACATDVNVKWIYTPLLCHPVTPLSTHCADEEPGTEAEENRLSGVNSYAFLFVRSRMAHCTVHDNMRYIWWEPWMVLPRNVLTNFGIIKNIRPCMERGSIVAFAPHQYQLKNTAVLVLFAHIITTNMESCGFLWNTQTLNPQWFAIVSWS